MSQLITAARGQTWLPQGALQQPIPSCARRQPPPQRRRAVRCLAKGLQQPLEEWDIVLYSRPSARGAGLGRVSKVAAGEVCLERLEEDAANLVWVVSHAAEERVPLAAVAATVAADYLQLVDPDRVSNPHGEHALEAYRLLEPVGEALAALAAEAEAAAAAAGGGDQ